jgi:hypothetical protein
MPAYSRVSDANEVLVSPAMRRAERQKFDLESTMEKALLFHIPNMSSRYRGALLNVARIYTT